jgi:dimethylsulfone monooxygenase
MNAGTSRRGREYAARYADMAYLRLVGHEPDDHGAQVAEIRDLARAHGREIEVWTNGYLVCRDSEDEAQDHVRWYAEELGDLEGATNALAQLNIESSAFDKESWMAARRTFIAGAGGVPLVGTAEQVVARLRELSDIGIDGLLLICAQWEPELATFEREVLPGLVAAGLRQADGA